MAVFFDLMLAGTLLLTMVAGARSGFFRELFAVIGMLVGGVAAIHFTPRVLAKLPHVVQGSGLGAVILFLLIFLLVFAVLRLIGAALATVWEGKEPSGPSRLFGLLLGTIRGLVLVVVLGGAAVLIAPPGNRMLAGSRVLPYVKPGIEYEAKLLPRALGIRLLDRWDSFHSVAPRKKAGEQVIRL